MRNRVVLLVKTFLWTMVVFVLAKVGFMLCCHPDLTMTDMKDVILHGLTLDLSTALYVLIVPLVVCSISIWSDRTPLLKQLNQRNR